MVSGDQVEISQFMTKSIILMHSQNIREIRGKTNLVYFTQTFPSKKTNKTRTVKDGPGRTENMY
jgi:hypothetical protein